MSDDSSEPGRELALRAGFSFGSDVHVSGRDPVLPSRLPIGAAAAVALAEIGDAARTLARAAGRDVGDVETSVLDGARTVVSFGLQRVDGAAIPRTNQSNPLVRLHRAGDGRWVFIHGGFPRLATGLADLLGVAVDAGFDEVGLAVERWAARDLEDAIAGRSLCGVMVRSWDEWSAHEHGREVCRLPLVRTTEHAGTRVPRSRTPWAPSDGDRPLRGLRVLDLTRVLAGPTCGRTLAAFGADVLQLTGPGTPNVPAFVIDTGHGKRRATVDLGDESSRNAVRRLALDADVVVQGYRPGIIQRFGLDEATLRSAGWSGVYGNISCFGPEGPFAERAGWEQLAQAVTGLAVMEGSAEIPVMVPAAVTDYTTGLLLAGRLMRELHGAVPATVDASLCQTAAWIADVGAVCDPAEASGLGDTPLVNLDSSFGSLDVASLGVRIQGLDTSWPWASRSLDADEPVWAD